MSIRHLTGDYPVQGYYEMGPMQIPFRPPGFAIVHSVNGFSYWLKQPEATEVNMVTPLPWWWTSRVYAANEGPTILGEDGDWWKLVLNNTGLVGVLTGLRPNVSTALIMPTDFTVLEGEPTYKLIVPAGGDPAGTLTALQAL